MTQTQLEARKERAANGTLIVSKTEDGYRVYSAHNPSHVYLVRQEGDRWSCACPDFELHKGDTTWRCKHILAVAPWPKPEATPVPSNGNGPGIPAATGTPDCPAAPKKRLRKGANGAVQMLIKRSVSPDGRIDSVSVEFSMPVGDIANGEIKDKAVRTLQIQKEVVAAFLKLNGQKEPAGTFPKPETPTQESPNGKPVFARMIDVGKVNGKWGERLCINVQVNGRWSRIFGSSDQLALQIARAGYHIDPENIEAGLRLNLACRVVTKPSEDGRYLNVERVLPLEKKARRGGPNDRDIPY